MLRLLGQPVPTARRVSSSDPSSLRGESKCSAASPRGHAHAAFDYDVLFKIQLVNFQLNLLCETTSGSVVVSAASAYVEGRRYSRPVRASASADVLQKHEVRIRLDNTAAYVVPTDIDDGSRALAAIRLGRSVPAEAGRAGFWAALSAIAIIGPGLTWSPRGARVTSQHLVDHVVLEVLDELRFTLDSGEV